MTDPVRSRYGGSKVRSGCITCKQRHLKCDEDRPSCQRCLKSGRVCEGYPQPATSPGGLKIVQYIPNPSRSLDPRPAFGPLEKRAFEYFQTKATIEISGYFSTNWWGHCFFHVAHNETAIKHAVVALSTLHELHTSPDSQLHASPEYAMQHYSKAIKEVVKLNIADNPEAVDVALTSCILFASIESVRGYYQSSLSHVFSGVKILREQPPESPGSRKLCIPRKFLISIFRRLESQVMEIGDTRADQQESFFDARSRNIADDFHSPDEALLSLEAIDNRFLHFLHGINLPTTVDDLRDNLLLQLGTERHALKRLYDKWQSTYQKMLHNENFRDLPEKPTGLVLNMISTSSRILVNIDICNIEADFDRFHDDFQIILRSAKHYIELTTPPRSSSSPPSTKNPIFTMTTGCIRSLVFTTLHCRDPFIRRRALHMLQTCNRREGLWDSALSAQVMSRVIQIEEAAALSHRGPRLNQITSAAQVPIHARVVAVRPEFGAEKQGTIKYVMMIPTVQKNAGREELVMVPQEFTESLTW